MMSDKDYILVDGLPEELKLDSTFKDVLALMERHHLAAKFRVMMANEPLKEYLVDNYSDQPETLSNLTYPYVYINFAKRDRKFCVKRMPDELGELRPDECWIDGFYQANMSISALISEVQHMNGLRDDKIIRIGKSAYQSVSCEIYGYIFGETHVCDLA